MRSRRRLTANDISEFYQLLQNPVVALIVCAIAICGTCYFSYKNIHYSDWACINANATESNCRDHREKRGRGFYTTITRCDYEIKYEFKDYEYTTVWTDHEKKSIGSILIDPNHPEKTASCSEQGKSNRNYAIAALIVALVFGGIGGYQYKKNKEEDSEQSV